MALRLIAHDAPQANAASASGGLRGVATVVAHARAAPPAVAWPPLQPEATGRVTSGGTWRDDAVSRALAQLLGPTLAPALRPTFEWYFCRGAFFHNDAHFDEVMFGVWCVAGPPADIVFPRAALRIEATPGHAAVFDPFEVHGVLSPGRTRYSAEDYVTASPSVFIGFELALTDAVRTAFRLPAVTEGRTLSSRTRIAASTGAFD